MATAAPHVKLLRQLASAKDDYLSGAFDISWDGAKATLYLIFGRPSHAVFDTDQAQIEGEAAIDALLAELPRTFAVSDWRRAMSPHETLSISIDELAGPFVRLAGSYADDPVSDESPEWWSADDSSPDLAFGLGDFPLLPGGRPLWAETSPENVNLAERLADLPPSILILTGAKLRAAAVVSGGDLIDAVWIDDEDQARGEAAGMAILGATKGTLAGYALDDPRVAEALTMLWRLPLAVSGIEMSWLDPASMLAAFRADGLDRVLVIDAPVRGIALFSRGGLVAVYSETQRSAVASPERLRSLLSQARGRLTVMERKPRPAGAAAAHTAPSATDFFGVLAPEAPAEVEPESEAAPAEVADTHVDMESAVTAGEPARAEAGTEAVAAPEAEAATEPASDTEIAGGTGAEPEVAAETGDEPQAAAETGDESQAAAETGDEPQAATETESGTDVLADPWAAETTPALSPSDAPEAEIAAEPFAAERAPDTALGGGDLQEPAAVHDSELPPPPPPDAEHAPLPAEADDEALTELAPPAPDADIAAAVQHAPPPTEAEMAASMEHLPPPPAPEAPAEPERKSKRPWWAFGGSRKNKGSATPAPTPEVIAAEAAAAHEAAEAATFAGWSVRQPSPETQPVWFRSHDHTEGPDDSSAGTEAPPPAADTVTDAPADETEAAAPAPAWSIVEPGTAAPRATSWPSTPAAPPAEEQAESAPPAEAPPENVTTHGWSARDVLADSVGWYQAAEPSHPDAAATGADDEHGAAAETEGAHDDAAATADLDTQTDADTHADTDDARHTQSDDVAHAQYDDTANAQYDDAAHAQYDDTANAQYDEAAHAQSDDTTNAQSDDAEHAQWGDTTHAVGDDHPHTDTDESADADADASAHAQTDESSHADMLEAPHDVTGETPSVDESDHAVAAEVDQSLAQWFHPPQAASDDHEAVAAPEHAWSAGHNGLAASDDHEPVAEDEHAPDAVLDQHADASDHDPYGASDSEPVAGTGDEPVDGTEHDPSATAEPSHDFWAEFASPDPDAAQGSGTEATPEESATTTIEAESVDEPAVADHRDTFTRRPSERTVAPWSWPLAESEPVATPAPHPSTPAPVDETTEPASASASEDGSDSDDWAPVFEGAGDQSDHGFFQRDEPVGSQFVDFDEVRTELVQIGIVWLGEANAVPVTALLRKTRSTIDDFVATIDTIRGLHLEGQDPASVQAMAREMHQQAAERLCGA